MKNKILLMLAFGSFASVTLSSCDSTEKKVEEARENMLETTENAEVAKNDLNKAIRDSSTEFQKFQKESDNRIVSYDKQIAELKNKINQEKGVNKSKYQKVIQGFESKVAEMKKELKEAKEDDKDKWKEFKTKFNSNLDDLGTSISNFFREDKKYN